MTQKNRTYFDYNAETSSRATKGTKEGLHNTLLTTEYFYPSVKISSSHNNKYLDICIFPSIAFFFSDLYRHKNAKN